MIKLSALLGGLMLYVLSVSAQDTTLTTEIIARGGRNSPTDITGNFDAFDTGDSIRIQIAANGKDSIKQIELFSNNDRVGIDYLIDTIINPVFSYFTVNYNEVSTIELKAVVTDKDDDTDTSEVITIYINPKGASPLEDIIVETYYIADAADAQGSIDNDGGILPEGSVTYRVFIDMLPGWEYQALYGLPNQELKIATSTSFFNNEDRGASTPSYSKSQAEDNTVMLDSWFSSGAAANGQMGVLKSEDNGIDNIVNGDGLLQNDISAIGTALTSQDGMIAGSPQGVTFVGVETEVNEVFDATSQAGNSFSTTTGSIASLNGSSGPFESNRVLVGQFTTDGVFSFELNIQIGKIAGGNPINYVAKNPDEDDLVCLPCSYPQAGIAITSPSNGTIFTTTDTVKITASVTGLDTITNVEFFANGTKIGEDATAPYAYNWPGEDSAKSYDLTAVSTNSNGMKDTSSVVTIDIEFPTFIQYQNNIASMILFPSPTHDNLTISIHLEEESTEANYTIYDLLGKVVLFKNLSSISSSYKESIDVSYFSRGQYFLKLTTDKGTATQKIIKY